MTTANMPRLVSTAEAAEALGVSTRTVLRWADSETIRRYQIGGTVRVDMDEIMTVMRGEK